MVYWLLGVVQESSVTRVGLLVAFCGLSGLVYFPGTANYLGIYKAALARLSTNYLKAKHLVLTVTNIYPMAHLLLWLRALLLSFQLGIPLVLGEQEDTLLQLAPRE